MDDRLSARWPRTCIETVRELAMMHHAQPEPRHFVVRSASPQAVQLHEGGPKLTCRGALLRAFEERAEQLGCSLDWLFAEALRRMLDEPVPAAEVDRLLLRAHTAEGTVCAAASDGMVIGRSRSAAQLLLVHGGVSRKHARLERRDEGWFVVDLGSFNGVYVNAVRTACSPIVPGDVIGIGPFAITVELEQ